MYIKILKFIQGQIIVLILKKLRWHWFDVACWIYSLVNQEKESHDWGVGTSQNLSLYLLINSFRTQKYSYRKSINCIFVSHSFWISLHEWILGKFKIFVALKCSNKHNMDSKAYQILHRKQILCVICTFLFIINET